MMFETTSPWAIAFFGLFGSALVVPLLKRLLFDARLRLVAKLEINEFDLPPEVTRAIPFEVPRHLRDFDGSHFIKGSISNRSKKTLRNVTIHFNSRKLYAQIGSNSELHFFESGNLPIGDIPARQEVRLRIWVNSYGSFSRVGSIKRSISISADEYDSIKIKLPFPDYQKARIENIIFFIVMSPALLWVILYFAAVIWKWLDPERFSH